MKIEIKLDVSLPFVVKVGKSSYSEIHQIGEELHHMKMALCDNALVSDVVISEKKAREIITKKLGGIYT